MIIVRCEICGTQEGTHFEGEIICLKCKKPCKDWHEMSGDQPFDDSVAFDLENKNEDA